VESLAEIMKIRVMGDAAAAAAEGLSLSAWARRHLKRIAKKRRREE
jgi:hypothetical protein